MQTCSNCGAGVREGARFCTACGTQLNEASPSNSAFSWGAAVDQEAAPDASVATKSWPAASPGDDTPGEDDDAADSNAGDSKPFAWNWDQPAEEVPVEALDEETGIVLDDPHKAPATGVVDATELDVLEIEPGTAPADVSHAETPDLSQMEDEAMSSTPDDDAAPSDDQETIAAWAQEWTSDEPAEVTTLASMDTTEDDDDDSAATVAKAERLIAELQALVPRLARPKPANPNQVHTPQRLAEELESASGESQWDDLREVLTQARDNPNDITYLMSVSGNAGRLLELMEHRDSLANTASRVASRLRNPEPDPQD